MLGISTSLQLRRSCVVLTRGASELDGSASVLIALPRKEGGIDVDEAPTQRGGGGSESGGEGFGKMISVDASAFVVTPAPRINSTRSSRSASKLRRCPSRLCMAAKEQADGKEGKQEQRDRAAKERQDRIRSQRAAKQKELEELEAGPRPSSPEASRSGQDGDVKEANTVYGENATGLFGWVNNNRSSKNAVYMDTFAGDGGNTGEMVQRIRGRGRTSEGFDVSVSDGKKDKLNIYVRRVGERVEGKAPIVLVHGILANSWSYRELLVELGKSRREAYAFDFPGGGYSSWPQPGYGFSFTEERMIALMSDLLHELELDSQKVILVTQGYIMSQYALLWAAKNASKIEKVVLLNQPLLPTSKLPFYLKQYGLPIVGPFVAQDAMRAERFIEKGGPYQMTLKEADRYREPFLESMMPGLALIDMVSKANFPSMMKRSFESAKQLGSDRLHVVWGSSDRYIPMSEAKQFCEQTGASFVEIDNAGFMVQNDWPPRVSKAIEAL